MMDARTLEAATPRTVTPSAVAWIDAQSATLALMRDDGRVSTCEVERGRAPGMSDRAYLGVVCRAIGDRGRVLILGPDPLHTTALERAYLTLYRRNGRRIEVARAGRMNLADVVDRVRSLAA